MARYLFILIVSSCSLLSHAACIDVVDLSIELPAQVTTDRGTLLAYQYDLVNDQYSLRWQKGDSESDVFGPFSLTMACTTPAVRWESEQFLLMERGCGTFCWYVKIFRLADSSTIGAPGYQRIERPLAFDFARNLLAYYYDQNLIRVKNLDTGYEQEIRTRYDCEYYSGLCFGDVVIEGATLNYSWRRGQNGEPISAQLDIELIQR